MNGSEKANNGRGNNRKKFRRRGGEGSRQGEPARKNDNTAAPARQEKKNFGRNNHFNKPKIERPKWVPPKTSTVPLPVLDCSFCGQPIRDLSHAISDKANGSPVHFECIMAKIAGEEKLEQGDTVAYIGGGRFGVGNFSSRTSPQQPAGNGFKIKKIIEWEDKEKKADWRSLICEQYPLS